MKSDREFTVIMMMVVEGGRREEEVDTKTVDQIQSDGESLTAFPHAYKLHQSKQ